MIRSFFKVSLALASLTISAVLVQADDLVPPPWLRGGPNTTSQEFTFDSPTDIFGHPVQTPAGTFGNPYGQPKVTNPGDAFWFPDDSSFNVPPTSRTGIVGVPSGGTLKFLIPNLENDANQKNIWAQVTWWADPGSNVVISPIAADPNRGVIIGTLPLGGGWNHTTASFVLDRQPPFEEFWVQNHTNSFLYLDQVVIDTQCVPEPASMVAFAVGGIGLALRRRRSKK